MSIIGYQNIEDVILSLQDPNTWWAISNVPWVSSPKINWATSIYNVEADGWIAWWSTNVSWSSSDYDTVAWSSWNVYLPDWTAIAITGGNTWNMSAITYIYYDMDTSSVATTTSAQSSVGKNKLLLCVAKPTSSGKSAEFQAFWTDAQSTFITADNIAANTITGNEIYANSITSSEIATWAITTSKIAVAAVWTNELDDWAVTADKIYVNQLSAITANLWDVHVGSTSWSWSWIRIYPYDSSTWRIDFYYNWSVIWYMRWQYNSNVWWWTVTLDWTAIVLAWDVYNFNTAFFGWKLRIPVWTNLY